MGIVELLLSAISARTCCVHLRSWSWSSVLGDCIVEPVHLLGVVELVPVPGQELLLPQTAKQIR